MNIMQTARKASLALVAASALLAIGAMETPAFARGGGHVSIGIGLGFPLFPAYGYGYGGYYGGYYGPYYPPYYAPYYAPPVAYAPAPVYQQPVQAVPTSDVYRSDNGQYCREYQSTVRIAGHYQNTYGTACQDTSGTWRITN